MDEKDKKIKENQTELKLAMPQHVMVPIPCTVVSFQGTSENENLIMTLAYDEKPTLQDALVISRFILSRDLAVKMHKLLEDVLKIQTKDEKSNNHK